jgi:hypothetical protein
MKTNCLKLAVLFLFVFFISCEDEIIYSPEERFVLQAYLYANEPVWDVTVRYAVPLTVADSVGEPINEAVITIYKNNVAFTLVSSSDSGTYKYSGDDLLVENGDIFFIEATVGEKTASATTTVPETPCGVFMSSDTISLPKIDLDDYLFFETIRELRALQSEIQLEVFWDNPDNELHFVVIENAQEEQVSIFPDLGGNFGMTDGKGSFRKITPPTRESSYQINFREIQYWGKYIVKVYRVNQEYANLYENMTQDSRDLNEPPTNIRNGLGIFSAFNSQHVYFYVVPQQ